MTSHKTQRILSAVKAYEPRATSFGNERIAIRCVIFMLAISVLALTFAVDAIDERVGRIEEVRR